MAYIGKSPTGTGIRQRYYFTATGGETSLSGTDDNGLTMSYADGAYVDVNLNGIKLVSGTDYTTTTANTIGGLAALSANDIVEVVAYDIFTVADTVSAKNGGTFNGNVTTTGNISAVDGSFSGDIAVTGDLTVDTNTLHVDSTNNRVGVGTSSPIAQSKLTVAGNSLSLTGADADFGAGGVRGMLDLAGGYLRMGAVNGGGSASGVKLVTPSGGEAVVVDSNGNVGIGTANLATNRVRVLADNPTSFTNAQFEILSEAGNVVQSFHAGGATAVLWKHPRATQVLEARNGPDTGYININANAFAVSSDYRLKENIVPISDATERLKKLNPVRFNFKPFEETGAEHHDKTVDGFLAHEVQDIVPEAITGTKDAMRDEEYEVTPAVLDDDGNVATEAVMGTRSVPDYQGIDQSKIVPLLVATIQELEARISELEAN